MAAACHTGTSPLCLHSIPSLPPGYDQEVPEPDQPMYDDVQDVGGAPEPLYQEASEPADEVGPTVHWVPW